MNVATKAVYLYAKQYCLAPIGYPADSVSLKEILECGCFIFSDPGFRCKMNL